MPCALVIRIRTFEELLISVKNAAPQGCDIKNILSGISVIVFRYRWRNVFFFKLII